MIRIKRIIGYGGVIMYRIERAYAPMQYGVFSKRQFYELLQDIEVVISYPYIIERTRMLILNHRGRTVVENYYSIFKDCRSPFSEGFTLKKLMELYKTALLLTKYEYPDFGSTITRF